MSFLLNRFFPVNPFDQHRIDSCEYLFSQGYKNQRPCDRRGSLPDVLESYHVDKRHWEQVDRAIVQKCFEEFRASINREDKNYFQGIFLVRKTDDDYPAITGLFWRVICRKEDMIKPEEIKKLPMPDNLTDNEKRIWEEDIPKGSLSAFGASLAPLYKDLRKTVFNKIYTEMKDAFDKKEDWVTNPLYERKIVERRNKLESQRNIRITKRITKYIVSVASLALIFFFSSQRGSDSPNEENKEPLN
jgi:hypothetical protein